MDFENKQCTVKKHGIPQILKPVKIAGQSCAARPLLLNAAQVVRIQKQGCLRSFTIQVTDKKDDHGIQKVLAFARNTEGY